MNTSVKIAGVEFKNPVMEASGTFGSGMEYSEFVDLSQLGAVVTKGVANVPWPGNPTPRIAEVYGGMLNAIGLQNPGIDVFCERDIPFLKKFDTKIIVNVCGKTTEDYIAVVERLGNEPIDMMEINISCPNVKEGGIAFGQDPKAVEAITREVKKYAKQPVIMKLSPNVTDITVMAKAAEAGGADALSLINTLTGMKIDIHRQKFAIANKTGGMSGPAVKPIAVRMVYQVANAVSLPIIGMGGIQNGEDAVEFLMAGATAVSVGTANFMNPTATIDTVKGIEKYMQQYAGDERRVERAMSRERFSVDRESTFDFLYSERNNNEIGQKINIALNNIEEHNSGKLRNVFRAIDFNSQVDFGEKKEKTFPIIAKIPLMFCNAVKNKAPKKISNKAFLKLFQLNSI